MPAAEEGQHSAGAAARVPHVPKPDSPSSRSDAVDPKRRRARLTTTERGLHAQSERKSSLARGDHALISGGSRGRNSRQKGQKTLGNMAGWCVLNRSGQKSVDLVSKNREKTQLKPANALCRRHRKPTTPQTGHLELDLTAKTPKERNNRTKTTQATIAQKG